MRAYLSIARVDHWFKNVFAVPGVLLALLFDPTLDPTGAVLGALAGIVGLCLCASANYTINEYLDAQFDREHPTKRHRAAALGLVHPAGVAAQWAVLSLAGLGVGAWANATTAVSLAVLLVMGVLYNVRPFRTKDLPYLDVLSESVNNPLRLWTGWAATGSALVPPLSLLLAYWMIGAFFMAVKRFAEFRFIGDPALAGRYRRSFRFYTESRLATSIAAYAAACGLFGGMFIMRYRLELVVAVPFVAVLVAWYLAVGYKPDSAAMNPERLYREPGLTAWTLTTFVVCCALLVVDLPWLYHLFSPSVAPPVSGG